MRAQGALEYLIIIAAVLGISAVTVMFITGTFSSTASGADISSCRLAAANCQKDLSLGVSTSCNYCTKACTDASGSDVMDGSPGEGLACELCKSGDMSSITSVPTSIYTTYLSTGINEKFGNAAYCSPNMYVLENNKTKFFIATPPIRSGTDCVTATAINYNYYAFSPMRIWTKDADTAYRMHSTILDDTYFLLYSGGSTYTLFADDLSRFDVRNGQVVIFPTNIPAWANVKITYLLPPGMANYVKVSMWVRNGDTVSRSVQFRWIGDQDPPAGTWFNETLGSCGICTGNTCTSGLKAQKWIAFMRCGGNDAYGLIAPNAQTFMINDYSGPDIITATVPLGPGQEYEYSFYIVSDKQGPAGQEWKPVQDVYNSISG